ncbi:anaerobic ribonucleoside-triphosphate reductase activating protein [Treponema sp. HNW]|uniref:anaerobic ribonucleoside-triphosphate reductase activating protein n=1 Tax=Treponema sp. HNW TaxID=3116654 RepID=UPI003D09B443
MLTGALIKTTLVDYPGKVACAWFLTGCSLRCPYCYNTDSVFNSLPPEESRTEDEVFEHLIKRRNVLSGFVISGGEPLIRTEIPSIIKKAKNTGYAVKLDTNGMHPAALEALFEASDTSPDFIAVDIKTSPTRYNLLAGNTPLLNSCGAHELLERTLSCVKRLPAARREFRTVLVPPLVQKADIARMAALLPPDASWRFAPFIPGNCLDPAYNDIIPYTDEQMQSLVSYAQSLIPDSLLR